MAAQPARTTGQKTMERILDAAEEVFIRFGYEGARMDQIADRAGVRKANIYYYFSSKEDLYHGLIDQILNNVMFEMRRFLDEPGTLETWELLDKFLDVLFDLVSRYRGLIGLAFGELFHPPRDERQATSIIPMLTQVEEMGKRMIADGIDAGVYRPQDPGQVLMSIEGAIFQYFLLPDERVLQHTGGEKFDPVFLDRRRQHLRELIKRILEK